jgi:hypothetical protein
MSGNTITLTFGAKDYLIRPVTIGQLGALSYALGKLRNPRSAEDNPAEAQRESFANMVEIISVALARDFPEMTPEKVQELPAEQGEFIAAVEAVLRHSGLAAPAPEA